MLFTKARRRMIAATGLAVVAVATIGSPAMADPWNTTSQKYTFNRSLNGTGSDTTQDVMNGLSAVLINADEELYIGSWDATVPQGQGDSITTYTNGTSVPRPNGSGQGLSALKAAVSGTVLTNARGTSSRALDRKDIQFSRSSSGASWTAGGIYSYIPFGVDAVTAAVHEENETLPRGYSRAELTAIYSAADGATVTVSGAQYVVGKQTTPNATLHPFLPQSGSGTRSFWLSQLGLTESTKGTAVTDSFTAGGETKSVQEHDGTVLASVPNALVPYSIGQYISQTRVATNPTHFSGTYGGVSVSSRKHGAELAQIGGVNPLSAGLLNTAFPIKRPVFNVVEHAAIGNSALSFGNDLKKAFVDDPATPGVEGAINSARRPGSSSRLVIEDFGFGSLGANGLTIDGVLYQAGDAESFRTN